MDIAWKTVIKKPNFWFAALMALLMVLHIQIPYLLSANLNYTIIRVLAFAGVISLVWRKREQLPPSSSNPFTFSIGLIFLGLVLIRNWLIQGYGDVLFELLPVFSAIALVLMSSGWQGVGFYRRELSLVAISALPTAHLITFLDNLLQFPILGAKFAAAGLYYLGFEVIRQGVVVALPDGVIEVNIGCSGLPSILVLLQLGALFSAYTPLSIGMTIFMPIFSGLIAFVVNGVRILLMALLINANNRSVFDYWHGGDGEQIFSLASILIFGFICERIWDISSRYQDMEQD